MEENNNGNESPVKKKAPGHDAFSVAMDEAESSARPGIVHVSSAALRGKGRSVSNQNLGASAGVESALQEPSNAFSMAPSNSAGGEDDSGGFSSPNRTNSRISRASRRTDAKTALREEMEELRSQGVGQRPGAVSVTSRQLSSGASDKAAMRAEIDSLRNQGGGSGGGDAKATARAELDALRKQNMGGGGGPGVVSVSLRGSLNSESQGATDPPAMDGKAVIRQEMNALRQSHALDQPGAVAIAGVDTSDRAARASRKASRQGPSDDSTKGPSFRDLNGKASYHTPNSPKAIHSPKAAPSYDTKPAPVGAVASVGNSTAFDEKVKALREDVALGTPLDDDPALSKMKTLDGAFTLVSTGQTERNKKFDSEAFDPEPSAFLEEPLRLEEAGMVAAQVINEEDLEAEYQEKLMKNVVAAEAVSEYELKAKARGKQRLWCCCFCILLAVVLGIAIPVSKSRVPEVAPTEAPTPQPVYDYLFDLMYPYSGDALFFSNETSPAYNALNWLYNNDKAGIDFKQANTSLLVERFTAATLYYSFGGEKWADQMNFLSEKSICDWNDGDRFGLECDETRQHVIGFMFTENNVSGTLPAELLGFTRLQYIDISVGGIFGTLPPQYSGFEQLTWIQVFTTSLEGRIPESYGLLTKLEVFNVYDNKMTGSVPENFLSDNRLMDYLILANNQFTGTLPILRVQGSVNTVAFDNNHFEGTIPVTFFQQKKFEYLTLSNNMLEGTIAEQIRALEALSLFHIDGNMFSGQLPSALGQLGAMTDLSLAKNSFTGSIPPELSDLSQLQIMDLSSNGLTGEIPSDFQFLRKLKTLALSSNPLTGTVPELFASMTSLAQFDIHNTSIVDGLDAAFCFGNVTTKITADCLGDTPKIDCPCCSVCCSEEECDVDLNEICRSQQIQLEVAPDRGASCECQNGGSVLSCADSCETCTLDGTICASGIDYGYTFNQTSGDVISYEATIKYTKGRSDTVQYIRKTGVSYCDVKVNGQSCEYCNQISCTSNLEGLSVSCNNLDDPASVSPCGDVQGDPKYLKIFALTDSSVVNGCLPPFGKIQADS